MGSRKISLEPAVSCWGPLGFSVTYVSLCGPHSFDTSALGQKVVEAARAPPLMEPFCERNRYLSHQVGLCELGCDWASASSREGDVASGTSRQATATKLRARTKLQGRTIGASSGSEPGRPTWQASRAMSNEGANRDGRRH